VEAHTVVRHRSSHISRKLGHRRRWGCQPYVPASHCLQEDSWYHFCKMLSSQQGHSVAERIRSTEKLNYLVGKRTRDPPDCRIVPQPTTVPRSPDRHWLEGFMKYAAEIGSDTTTYDVYIKLRKCWLRHSEVDRWDTQIANDFITILYIYKHTSIWLHSSDMRSFHFLVSVLLVIATIIILQELELMLSIYFFVTKSN
jgi:hypothetical protein